MTTLRTVQIAECGVRNAASRITHHASRRSRAFTLLELLMVIAIMGLLAAISLPSIRSLKPNAKVAGTRQLLDAVGRARQLAVSQRTTVYMVFLPANFWNDSAYAYGTWTADDQTIAAGLLDKQMIGYAYVCLRSVGDQPGVHTPRYMSSWKTLPEGSFIPAAKFAGGLTVPYTALGTLVIPPFSYTTAIPFPSETTLPASPGRPYIALPYIAFDGTGQVVSGSVGVPELIPVTEGSVSFARDQSTKQALPQPAQLAERPVGNTLENFSLVYVDRLTGRAHVERRNVQ